MSRRVCGCAKAWARNKEGFIWKDKSKDERLNGECMWFEDPSIDLV